MSQSFANRGMVEFRNKGLGTDAPVSATQPNWEAYRLSFQVRKILKNHSFLSQESYTYFSCFRILNESHSFVESYIMFERTQLNLYLAS